MSGATNVREFCDLAFKHLGLSYEDHVTVDERFFVPPKLIFLSEIAKPPRHSMATSTTFESLVEMMVDAT